MDLVVGEHHVDGDTFFGGRWFGRWWRTPVGAANSELKRGSGEWMHREATGKRWEAEVHARERIELDPVAGRGGGVEEGDFLGALPVARQGLGGVQGWCGY